MYQPTFDPDEYLDIQDLAVPLEPSESDLPGGEAAGGNEGEPWYAPFSSATAYRFVEWHCNDKNQKSIAEDQRFIDNVLGSADFDLSEG